MDILHLNADRQGFGGNGLIGCSLYTPMVNEIGPAIKAWRPPRWHAHKIVGPQFPYFYFQLPCSWGAVYTAKHWLLFLQYYEIRKNAKNPPLIPNSRTNEWNKSWKRMLIELMLLHGWYLLYPNFDHCASFSTNYFEWGIHSQPDDAVELKYPDSLKKRDWRFTVPLLHTLPIMTASNLDPDGLESVPCVDLYHQRVPGTASFFAPEDVRAAIASVFTS